MISKLKFWLPRVRLPAFSLFLAIVAWFLVHSGQRVREEHPIPIVYKNLPENLAFARKPPEFIEFGFVGVFHRIRAVDIDRLTYEVDLSEARAGVQSIETSTGQFFFPVDVELVNPRPRRFEVFLEPKMKKEVPVELKLVGEAPSGMILARLEAKPNPIPVEGPMSTLAKLEKFEVPIAIRSGELQWKEFKEVSMPDWTLGASQIVEVSVEFSNESSEVEFRDVSVVSGSPQVRLQVYPARATVILQGAETSLKRVGRDLKVEIPVEGLSPGRYRLEGRISEQKGIRLVRIEPKSFIVEVLR
jgi:YbbR domain-containing protein